MLTAEHAVFEALPSSTDLTPRLFDWLNAQLAPPWRFRESLRTFDVYDSPAASVLGSVLPLLLALRDAGWRVKNSGALLRVDRPPGPAAHRWLSDKWESIPKD